MKTFPTKKLLFILPILSILVAALIASILLTKKNQDIRRSAANKSVSLYFSPDHLNSLSVGGRFNIRVILSANQKKIVGVDLALNFDKNKLELTNITPGKISSLQTFLPVRTNGSFDKQSVIDQANKLGKIRFGVIAFNWQEKQFTHPETSLVNPLTTLTFKLKKNLDTTISFDFHPGKTTDSNVVGEAGNDLLADVNSVNLIANHRQTVTPTPTIATTVTLTATLTPTITPTFAPGQSSNTPTPITLAERVTSTPATTQTSITHPSIKSTSSRVQTSGLAKAQPTLPISLPVIGPTDWVNWLKAGLSVLGVGAALLFLL